MFLTAAAVGAVLAAMILYVERKNKPGNQVKDAAKDAYRQMNGAIGSLERPAHRAMG